mmetsp:Transcript_3394/g.7015  ORF Transcript_3394/g.7015 Transcript_3394/m.7015 type:complete len:352 (+) Transcript_3394:372-1427(+)|eukprot:CAMPEP_0204899610 /NCGR_PEP_ID=MMETSP1397-20131031/1954_1 /ASSEMBLY_ACC=CAM_ASM_000891 /TAXON_ID=49980 /ORGANISM="Climacostomum Climacostomum virens, Strain Stock W-24" /LENGTH=351 /DNA_ID=CAMNT_0052067587 /DNA_START=344 /DNA_END=1399 /DNA_ORIENTATION=-
MEELPQCILIEVASFLRIPDILKLTECSFRLHQSISQSLRMILSQYLGLSLKLSISEEKLIRACQEMRKRRLLKFKPLFTDGGVSDIEYMNFFSSMWSYDGLVYSTQYKEGNTNALRPVNCVGYFAGGYQDDHFFSTFHHDEMNWRVNYRNIPVRYNLPAEDMSTYRNADPIYRRGAQYENILNFPEINDSPQHCEGKIVKYACKPPSEIAIVSEVAVARPLFYTGSVRTLCIFFSSSAADFTPVNVADGFESYETARDRAKVIREYDGNPISFIEFAPDVSAEFYPVLWVRFNSYRVNNYVHKLHKPLACLRTLVYLIDIDDRRDEYNLTRMEPNFDIAYCVMIGAAVQT